MIQKIKTLILSLSLVFAFAAPVALPAVASAAVNIPGNVCSGASDLTIGTGKTNAAPDQGSCTTDESSSVNNIITTIINVFSVVVGIVAVIMIIFAGFKYITSGGKDEGVKNAKNTILYALIGLVIVALAQIIVKFVLQKTTATTS